MKTTVIAIILVLTTFCVSAQNDLKVYKTYKDYLNDKGDLCSFKRLSWGAVAVGLVAKKGKEKVNINGKEHWGYKYKDVLFRFDKLNQPARVISIGKIIYYENGPANMEMVEKNQTYGQYRSGYVCYVSKDLEMDLVPLNTTISDAKSKTDAFKKKHPEYKEFFDCLGKSYQLDNARICIDKFEGR